ncbi:unnamed protein product, partial [Hymenolepis diminuta]
MTDRNNSDISSDDESAWTPKWIYKDQTDALNDPLDEFVKNLLEPSVNTRDSCFEESLQQVEERSENEIIEEIVRNFLPMCGTQHDSSTQSCLAPNVEHFSPEETTNDNVLPEKKHEPIEFVKGNLIAHQLNDSTVANSANSYFYCPSCSYRSTDRSQVQDHFHANHEEDTTSTTFESPIGGSNPCIDNDLQELEELLDKFIANVTENSMKITEANQNYLSGNLEDKDTFVGDSENPQQSSAKSASTTLGLPKQYSPVQKQEKNRSNLLLSNRFRENSLPDRQINKSTQADLKNGKLHYSSCSFNSADRSLDKNNFHACHEKNTHSSTSHGMSECDVCEKKFPLNENSLDHLKVHNEENLYKCENCGKKCSSNWCLVVHRRTHSVEQPFRCEVCGKKFSLNKYLITHQWMHAAEQPFTCEVCGRKFCLKKYLTAHQRAHTGEKPFICVVCNERFSQSGTLIAHERTHKGEQPFTREVCGKKAPQSGTLIAHERTHKGEQAFTREVCGKKASQSGTLIAHERTHTGEQPFSCEVCGKGFSQKGALTAHQRTHTGEQAFTR